MPRPKKKRKIKSPPKMLGFKPFGIKFCNSSHISLQYEEYESVKLVVYDKLSQDTAAEMMEVSRPTLTRIYNSALKKIAAAFVEGKSILIKGGDFEFGKEWYKCKKCFKLIETTIDTTNCVDCLTSNKNELISLND